VVQWCRHGLRLLTGLLRTSHEWLVGSISNVHNRNIAEWEDPDWDEVPAERLKQYFDRMMDRMENGGLFPTESD
jgi:hypothetical protein